MADEKLNTGQEQTEQPSLFDTGPDVPAPEPTVKAPEQTAVETDGAPGGVVVSAEQIEKLMAERNAAARAEVEKKEPPEPKQPPEPRDATRAEKEEIVYLNLSELFPFKDHPFGVRDDAEMKGLVESVKDNGVHQPALVRPREGGGYEIIAGHRRQRASKLAGFANMPCIVRNMTDDEAILAMTDDNLRHREKILPMEKAQSLKMQVEAISHQGAKLEGVAAGDVGKRSTEIVGERNGMAEHKKYYIHVPGALVEVSEGVYFAYYQEKRRGRTLREKDERNGTVSYDGLDTPELTGQEMIPDRDAVSVEDAAIANILRDRLHRCLDSLDEPDRQLILNRGTPHDHPQPQSRNSSCSQKNDKNFKIFSCNPLTNSA